MEFPIQRHEIDDVSVDRMLAAEFPTAPTADCAAPAQSLALGTCL